ncbi:MAG: RnfABCDGE type electron transport complex subunit G [Candidatus Omnitrophica bacterium]|nr:RnfABCDGE type electron transport complex subunit G [Candidatus Omnitrophota bacterium]
MKEMLRYGMILGLICLVSTGLLAAVNNLTKTRIENQARAEIETGLKEVLAQAASFEPVGSEEKIVYYKGFDQAGQLVGCAFIASQKGYSSVIETMVGMTIDGTITAIKVISQNETPGLGCRVNEAEDDTTLLDFLRGKKAPENKTSRFCAQFSGKKIAEIDGVNAITGATISSRAVIDSVRTKAEEIYKLLRHE